MKGYVFHCQLDYENVPYPCTATGFGTVADNGCGPCCASMVAENMLHISFPVQEACHLAIACGARDKPGTDMHVFAPAFAQMQRRSVGFLPKIGVWSSPIQGVIGKDTQVSFPTAPIISS